MDKPTCSGCGAVLQSDAPDGAGFVPAEVLARTGPGTLCRRCYRIHHYNAAEPSALETRTALNAVSRGIAQADAGLYIVDPFDFEGTWRPDWLTLFERKPYWLVLNKIDLLPSITHAEELKGWAFRRVKGHLPMPGEIIAAGTRKDRDLDELKKRLAASKWRTFALVGASNAGKSSLLRALAEPGTRVPTVSSFPGTTQGVVRVPGISGRIWVDTPGLAPGDRLTDRVCLQCAAQLTPARRLQAKLYQVEPGQAILFSGYAMYELASSEGRTFLCYAGGDIRFHRTTGEKGMELLGRSVDWLGGPCTQCAASTGGWTTREYRIRDGEDLAVAGLGWVSLRGGDAALRVTVLDGTMIQPRPGIFGRRAGHVKRPGSARTPERAPGHPRKNF